MRKGLTEKDIKVLKYQCRMGYVIPAMIFIIGTIVSVAIYESLFNTESNALNIEILVILASGFFALSFLISYKMNHKYLKDIRFNRKVVETKIIQKKESKSDYEAGSGTMYIGEEMKGYDSFSIIVENYRYRVDKDLFMSSKEGDEILFNYAPISRYLISIERKKKTC